MIYLDVSVSFNYLFKTKFYVTTFVESAVSLGIKIWKFSCRSLFKLLLKMAIISNNIEIYILIKLNLCFLLRFRHWGLRTKMTVKCELPRHILEAPGNDSNMTNRDVDVMFRMAFQKNELTWKTVGMQTSVQAVEESEFQDELCIRFPGLP